MSALRVSERPVGIADASGEVADQEDDLMAQQLELAQLVDDHGVADVEVGRGRVQTQLDPERRPGRQRPAELPEQFFLDQQVHAPGLEDGQLALRFLLDGGPGHPANPFRDRRAFYHRRVIPATEKTAPNGPRTPRGAPIDARHAGRSCAIFRAMASLGACAANITPAGRGSGAGSIVTAFWCIILAMVIGFGAAAGIFAAFLQDLPSLDGLEEYQPSIATTLYTDQDEPFHSFYEQRRMLVPLNQIPAHLKQAVLAVEDSRFFEHHGLSARGIGRALVMNLLARRKAQGGSTITQQLARGLFLTPEKNISRKIKEALLAVEIEKQFSKEKILELYFNLVYFGHGAYGVEAAAQTYFKKSVGDLSLAEAAMLAGLPSAPNRFSPIVDPQRARRRRDHVLTRMVDEKYITRGDADEAGRTPFNETLFTRSATVAPYFVEHVRQILEETYGAYALYNTGLKSLHDAQPADVPGRGRGAGRRPPRPGQGSRVPPGQGRGPARTHGPLYPPGGRDPAGDRAQDQTEVRGGPAGSVPRGDSARQPEVDQARQSRRGVPGGRPDPRPGARGERAAQDGRPRPRAASRAGGRPHRPGPAGRGHQGPHRRLRLRAQQVQPSHPGEAAARLRLQAVHLRRGV